ncbi:MAG: DUF4281 domain-containing protein [Sandarakinorhabdus sp.]|nr:DUF4281 domain-containing protein [Sandarakinorhabdus sp.]
MEQADLIFTIANWLVLAGWLALLVAPLRRAPLVLAARIAAASVAVIYVMLVARGLIAGPGLPEGAGFTSLDAVTLLFSRPEALLGAWVHLLALDLFVGSWMAEDAPKAGVPHWLLVPMLGLTLMAGPAGLLIYLLVAAARRRRSVPA